MNVRLRRVVLACVVAVSAIAVLVPGGSAADRAVWFTFDVVPGPGEVTYGQNVAYKAEISNTSGTTLTHVIFRMRKPFVGPVTAPVPAATFEDSTCPQNNGRGVDVTNSDGSVEWTCDFGNLPAYTTDPSVQAQKTLSVVWGVDPSASLDDCPNCLQATPRVTVKEGLNDQTNPNDAFAPRNQQIPATLLAANSDESHNNKSAGGYETAACTPGSGQSSLVTKQKLDPVLNKISTEVCITQVPPRSSGNLGLATTILEGVVHPRNPGLAQLETSDVCVAAPGVNCGPYNTYLAQVFDPDHPMTVVLRVPDALLLKNQTLTKVWHNADQYPNPLQLCGTGAVPLNGCLVENPTLSKGAAKDRFWTITVKTLTNGWFTGG